MYKGLHIAHGCRYNRKHLLHIICGVYIRLVMVPYRIMTTTLVILIHAAAQRGLQHYSNKRQISKTGTMHQTV